MKKSIQAIEDQLKSISETETIEVNLKQLLFIYKAIEDWRGYFHNENHYPTIEEVKKFVGNKNKGMYSVLNHIYMDIFGEILPKDVEDRLE